ncbi:MAG: serine hydrolase [Lachnospiraceae bacterium]|nr:serine hydrolase [Lachnospiraceae bacterium]MCI1726691.1 serine hydrolase [Lachnospiraceae bacterium]
MSGHKNKKVLLTAVLIFVLAASLALGGFGVYALRTLNNLEMVMPYSNKDLAYTSTNETAMQTEASFSRNLCVGEDNTANSSISLQGNESGALFSLHDRSILFSKNMYDKIYPASITKLMTVILALKYGNMDDVVTITWEDLELEAGSQVVGFQIGDQVKMNELLYGLIVHSGNDAAQAIARHIGGTQAKFVDMMNEEAAAIGATGTHFMNPTGLQDENHYTTVYDIYLMLNEALKYDEFTSMMQVSVYELSYSDKDGNAKTVTLDSTDHYLTGDAQAPRNVTVLGGKTGTTSSAGSCLALTAQNAYGQPYIAVIVKAANKDALYTDMNSILSQINS